MELAQLKVLGRGESGVVYAVSDTEVLKVVKRKKRESVQKWKDTLVHEHAVQEALAALDLAPKVGPLHFEGTSVAYIPMGRIHKTLREMFNDVCDDPNPKTRTKCVGIPLNVQKAVVGVLEKAIAHGFLHQDSHPGNMAIDTQGRVRLIDFGYSVRCDAQCDESLSLSVCDRNQRLMGALYQVIEHMDADTRDASLFYNVIYKLRTNAYVSGAYIKHANDIVVKGLSRAVTQRTKKKKSVRRSVK